MARYRAPELYDVLLDIGCVYEGDETEHGLGWFAPNGHVFTIPKPVDDWFDADVIDLILSDRWIPKPVNKPKRYD
jgi:hypothetical protein